MLLACRLPGWRRASRRHHQKKQMAGPLLPVKETSEPAHYLAPRSKKQAPSQAPRRATCRTMKERKQRNRGQKRHSKGRMFAGAWKEGPRRPEPLPAPVDHPARSLLLPSNIRLASSSAPRHFVWPLCSRRAASRVRYTASPAPLGLASDAAAGAAAAGLYALNIAAVIVDFCSSATSVIALMSGATKRCSSVASRSRTGPATTHASIPSRPWRPSLSLVGSRP